jgi:hypothetical protein
MRHVGDEALHFLISFPEQSIRRGAFLNALSWLFEEVIEPIARNHEQDAENHARAETAIPAGLEQRLLVVCKRRHGGSFGLIGVVERFGARRCAPADVDGGVSARAAMRAGHGQIKNSLIAAMVVPSG